MGFIDQAASGFSRRRFLVTSLTAAGGLAVGICVPRIAGAEPVAAEPWDKTLPDGEINAWVVIEPDDQVIIRVAQSEMGEGVLTSMPMIVAEELACDWTKVKAEYASANRNVREDNIYRRMGIRKIAWPG